MAKLIFILGLSGSGKTHLSESLKKETGAKVFTNLLAEDSQLSALIESLREGQDCIIDEVRFCLPAYREQILQPLSQITDLDMRWICYENDLETANWNVIHRTDKGDPAAHLDLNLRLHPHYTYPVGAEIVSIHKILP
jgi:deoxyadenosine/deoxycytidine kinase